MESTVTVRGQTAIPVAIRKRYNIQPQTKLEWIDDGHTITVLAQLNQGEGVNRILDKQVGPGLDGRAHDGFFRKKSIANEAKGGGDYFGAALWNHLFIAWRAITFIN